MVILSFEERKAELLKEARERYQKRYIGSIRDNTLMIFHDDVFVFCGYWKDFEKFCFNAFIREQELNDFKEVVEKIYEPFKVIKFLFKGTLEQFTHKEFMEL